MWRTSTGASAKYGRLVPTEPLALIRTRYLVGPTRRQRNLSSVGDPDGSRPCTRLAHDRLGVELERSRVRLERSTARVVGLMSGRNVSGRVGSRRDPSGGQVSLVVDFAIPLLRRGAGAFIATVTRYPYLNPLFFLLLIILLHLTTPSVVLAARHAPTAEGCRPCPPYLY
ncbi:hypothetical protein BHM03_00038996 [Ensete ventricosum]|nr:hypothetical protein BHM03_00038996 [Ensete ventricosum]